MKFSSFLRKIYNAKNNKITTQEEFVRYLFKSYNINFSYSDNYCKKLLNGNKPLTDEIRNFVLKNNNFDGLVLFLNNNINSLRLSDLFKMFNVEQNEKKDLSIFSEALAIQFENYMKYGELKIPTAVNDIYLSLLDSYGNGSIEYANEKALIAAQEYIFQAISSLNNITIKQDILALKGPFDNFFNNIYYAFRAFEANSNLKGRNYYQSARDKVLSNSSNFDNYLNRISEPGALPIDFVKKLNFTLYDNYTFKDQVFESSVRLFDKDESVKIKEIFKNINFYPVNEYFFTLRISFHIEDTNNNLMDHAMDVAYKTIKLFNLIKDKLDQNYKNIYEINVEIDKAWVELNNRHIQYVVDGIYYPLSDEITYAPSSVVKLAVSNTRTVEPGATKFDVSKHPILSRLKSDASFQNKFTILFDWQNIIWGKSQHGDLMAELLTFNKDNTFRWFMVPVTSKARVYRLVRDVTNLVEEDQIISFMYTGIFTTNEGNDKIPIEKLVQMTSEERINIGKDYLIGYSYSDNKTYSRKISKDDSILGKVPYNDDAFPSFFTPLIKKIQTMLKDE